MERRSVIRVAVTPEEIGLCGCWQVVAVQRERIELGKNGKSSLEIGYYVTSIGYKERGDKELLQIIGDHWAAIENGSHYRRDVTFGEDKSRVSNRGAAQAMAALRNLAIGIYELEKERGRTKIKQLAVWSRRLKATAALAFLRK